MMKEFSQQTIENELIAITKQLLHESGEISAREIKLDVSLEKHLGIDSLARAELFQRIEKTFKVRLPDRLLAEAETLNNILSYLLNADESTFPPLSTKKITSSQGEKAQVDTTKAQSLTDVLLMYGEQTPHKPHIFFQNEDGQEETITYEKLLMNASRVANGLKKLGLRQGETVAIMQPTHPGFFYTFFGTLLAGGIPVPIYPPFRMHLLESYAKTEAKILANAEVRILVTFEEAEKLSRLLKTFVSSLKHVTTVQALLEADAFATPFNAKEHDYAFIQYTSGSTSAPKGVLLTHYNLLSNIRGYGKAIQVTPEDITVSWLPLYHDMGLIGKWLGSLFYGVPLVLLTPFSFLNHPERWLWAIHNYRGTISAAPNFAYELCVRKLDASLLEGLDLSSWRIAANGAEKIYPRTMQQFAEKFAPYQFKREALMPVYGLAESTVGLTIPPLNRGVLIDKIDRKKFEENKMAVPSKDEQALEFVACGLPLENHEVRIVDDEMKVLSERHVGRVQFRGPSSMQGYYRNQEATSAISHDGWLDSGDLGYIAHDELYITGRRKDLIIKAGRNIYPAEIEEWVGTVHGVRQGCVAAFGVTDGEHATEKLIIVAETREKNKIKLQEMTSTIRDVVVENLDVVPDQIILAAPHVVPKTSSGKLQRAACKTLYLEKKLNKSKTPVWLQIIKLGAQGILQKLTRFFVTACRLFYTFYMFFVIVLSAIPLYFIILFSSRDVSAKACKFWGRFVLFAGGCRVVLKGKENLEKKMPVIFAANHASYVDSILLISFLPYQVRFVGKKELFSLPILKTVFRKLDYLPIDRFDLNKGLEDTRHMKQALQEGHPLLIYPEGTFGYASGLRPFRLGAFKLATETKTPICPVALQGTRVLLRDEERLLRPGKVYITICTPLYATGSEWQNVIELKNKVRVEIAKYCGESTLDMITPQTVAPKRE